MIEKKFPQSVSPVNRNLLHNVSPVRWTSNTRVTSTMEFVSHSVSPVWWVIYCSVHRVYIIIMIETSYYPYNHGSEKSNMYIVQLFPYGAMVTIWFWLMFFKALCPCWRQPHLVRLYNTQGSSVLLFYKSQRPCPGYRAYAIMELCMA